MSLTLTARMNGIAQKLRNEGGAVDQAQLGAVAKEYGVGVGEVLRVLGEQMEALERGVASAEQAGAASAQLRKAVGEGGKVSGLPTGDARTSPMLRGFNLQVPPPHDGFDKSGAYDALRGVSSSAADATSLLRALETAVERGSVTWREGANALVAGQKAENSTSDAIANFQKVIDASGRLSANVGDVNRVFLEGLSALGSSATAAAQARFSAIVENAAVLGAPIADVAAVFQVLRRAENDEGDAIANLKIVTAAARDVSRPAATLAQAFNDLLKIEGASSTGHARAVFALLIDGMKRTGTPANQLVELYIDGYRAENSRDDALKNFARALDASASSGMPPAVANRAIVDLLKLEGNDATSHVQAVFSSLVDAVGREGAQSLAPLVREYALAFRAENDRDQALGNFKLVLDAAKRLALPVKDVNGSMIDLLACVGNSATDHMRAVFAAVVAERQRSGEGLAGLVSAYNAIHRAENDAAQALGNLRVVTEVATRTGKSPITLAAAFTAMLSREGATKTDEVRAAFRAVHGGP